MKKAIIFSFVIIAAFLLISGCSQGTTPKQPVAQQPTTQKVVPQPEAAPAVTAPQQNTPVKGGVETVDTQQQKAQSPDISSAANVELQSFAFSPQSLNVKKGTTVTWTQMDSAPHTIVSDTGLFESPQLSKGQTWSFTFNDAGTFSYHCSIHPSMTAKIVVE
jgi:plastocyanin